MRSLLASRLPGGLVLLDGFAEAPGSVLFVSSTTGVDGSQSGLDPSKPFATLAAAIVAAVASQCDVIYVAPQHVENLAAAAAIDASKAGLQIIGLGRGLLKPTFTFITLTTATFKISAANVLLKNCRFVSNVDSLAMMLDVSEQYFECENCDFVAPAAKDAVSFVQLLTTKNYMFFRDCRFESAADPTGVYAAAGTGCIYFVDSKHLFFDRCHFYGYFETAIFHNRTTAAGDLWVRHCTGIQLLDDGQPFRLVAGATGGTVGGGFNNPSATDATEATLVGTIGDGFFVSPTTGFGNDGAAGGQGAIIAATAS